MPRLREFVRLPPWTLNCTHPRQLEQVETMSLRGQIYLNSDVIVKPDGEKTGKSRLSFQRNICSMIHIYARDIVLYYVNINLWVLNTQSHHFVKQRNFLLLLGKLYMAAKGQRLRQEAADWGHWGAIACCEELWQTRDVDNLSSPSRQSPPSMTSALHNPRPQLLFPSRSSLEDHFHWNLWR